MGSEYAVLRLELGLPRLCGLELLGELRLPRNPIPISILTARDALLHTLTVRPGMPLSRDRLQEQLDSWDQEIASNAIEVHLYNLRKKIGSDKIENVRGVGYRVVKS